jgi:isocitrate dehydrogenase (NAD+)
LVPGTAYLLFIVSTFTIRYILCTDKEKRLHTVTLIPGDGIGPSIAAAAQKVIAAAGVQVEWDVHVAGTSAVDQFKDPLPTQTIDSIAKNKVALKGPLTTPIGTGFRSVNVALRKEFDLFVNLRPAKSMIGVKSRFSDIDLVVFRENTEEFYAGIEHYIDARKSAAETIGVVTRSGSERIVRAAFEFARKYGRKKMTIVHKANIMKYTGGLFLDVGREVAKKYPEIEFNDKIVDNMAMQLVMNPHQFDVIVTTNLFGDILSDLCSGLVGGLGLAPGANIGAEVALFEAVHGSAPDIAGKDIANPCALILAASMMLDHLGEPEAAKKIHEAVATVVRNGKYVTKDLNPENYVGTTAMAEAVISEIRKS